MYHLLIAAPSNEKTQCREPQAINIQLCLTLARERDSLRAILSVPFHIDVSCLQQDYLTIINVPLGILCSQSFIDVLTHEAVPFTSYPAQLLERGTEQPLAGRYHFWIPQWIEGTIDWERSEEWIDAETGNRRFTKLVVTDACEAAAPLLFQTKERGYHLVHERLRKRLEAAHITGIAFAPLDAISIPYEGLKRLELERLLQEHPDDYVRWCQLSSIFTLTYRYHQALEALDKALMLKPDFAEAWEKRGRTLFTLGHFQEACKALERAIELQPRSRVWKEYCAVLRALGRYEEAEVSAEHLVQLWSHLAVSWYELAATYVAQGQHEKALQAIEQCLQLGGGEVQSNSARAYRLKEETLLQLKSYEEALVTYETGLRRSPFDSVLWQGKATALYALEQIEEARRAKQEGEQLEQRREKNLKKGPI